MQDFPPVSSGATVAHRRWQRSLMFPFGLPRKPRPPPPLPPKQRPNLASIDKCLLDALEEAFRFGGGHCTASESETCFAPQLQYSSRWAGDACRILAAYIMRKLDLKFKRCCTTGMYPSVHLLNHDRHCHFPSCCRYKSACVVRIIEKRHQGFCCHFAALWDAECDGFSVVAYETSSFLAYATLALVYYD